MNLSIYIELMVHIGLATRAWRVHRHWHILACFWHAVIDLNRSSLRKDSMAGLGRRSGVYISHCSTVCGEANGHTLGLHCALFSLHSPHDVWQLVSSLHPKYLHVSWQQYTIHSACRFMVCFCTSLTLAGAGLMQNCCTLLNDCSYPHIKVARQAALSRSYIHACARNRELVPKEAA